MTKEKHPDEVLPTGPPEAYKDWMPRTVRKLCMLGCTDKQISEVLEIGARTLARYKQEIPEMRQAMAEGRALADAEVASSLYHRAIGYSHPEEKIFNNQGEILRAQTTKHYPPDTGAASLWLRNRQPENWRDSKEISGKLTLEQILEELE